MEPEEGNNTTYILRCSDGTYYTGWTNNLKKRLKEHNAGRGAKYTRGRTPVELVYMETHGTRQEAMQREAWIKKLPREADYGLLRQQPDISFSECGPLITKAYLQQSSTS